MNTIHQLKENVAHAKDKYDEAVNNLKKAEEGIERFNRVRDGDIICTNQGIYFWIPIADFNEYLKGMVALYINCNSFSSALLFPLGMDGISSFIVRDIYDARKAFKLLCDLKNKAEEESK